MNRALLSPYRPLVCTELPADFMCLKMMASMIAPNGYDFGWIIDDIEKCERAIPSQLVMIHWPQCSVTLLVSSGTLAVLCADVTSELDFTREAFNARSASDALSALSPAVPIPEVISSLSLPGVITTHFVDGLIRLDRPADLAKAGIDGLEVGRLISQAFGELALVHGLVHGDPHAGNVYARARPSTGQSQLVILDHGLYHRLSDADRLAVCDLILACATPWPTRSRVLGLSKRFAGALSPLFPALLSPTFAFSTGLSIRQLRAAAEGRLPEGTTLADVWQTLVAMHAGESDVLGFLHSLGYIRGLQNSLAYPERKRVDAMVACATRATCKARHTVCTGIRLRWELRFAAWRVSLLFAVLRIVSALLACATFARKLAQLGRVAAA